MDLRLAGKVAVVTGASKGIGLAATRALVSEGESVVAAARDLTDDLSQLTTQAQVHPVQVDLGTPDGPARLIDEAVVAYGGPDVLVNNVGADRAPAGSSPSPTTGCGDWPSTSWPPSAPPAHSSCWPTRSRGGSGFCMPLISPSLGPSLP
jgi:NAD(P)-dependent dehydrogenase (short-subunit alcohol dehydrogenase family)